MQVNLFNPISNNQIGYVFDGVDSINFLYLSIVYQHWSRSLFSENKPSFILFSNLNKSYGSSDSLLKLNMLLSKCNICYKIHTASSACPRKTIFWPFCIPASTWTSSVFFSSITLAPTHWAHLSFSWIFSPELHQNGRLENNVLHR